MSDFWPLRRWGDPEHARVPGLAVAEGAR